MTGASRPRRCKMSLSFLSRKKNTRNLFEEDVPASGTDSIDTPEPGLGDNLEDIAEEKDETLQENGVDHTDENVAENALEHDEQADEKDEEKFTLALVLKTLSPLELHKKFSLVKGPMSYPPTSPPRTKKTDRRSSMMALDSSTRSSSLRTESSSQMSTGAGGRAWLSKRCGFGSCSKQMDMEAELRARERAGHPLGLGHRAQRSRTESMDPFERNEWSFLTEKVENDVVKNKVIMRKKKGHKMSSRLAPSAGISPTLAVHPATPGSKLLLRDPYEEVREAARYEIRQQFSDHHRAAVETDCGGGSRMLDTSTAMEDNPWDERVHPWERSFSSPCSDDELFTTSFELDGQRKTRRKTWSSNSSDDMESRHRRPAVCLDRSKNTGSNNSVRSVLQEDEDVDDHETILKKGSRIIFLSTPPRPKETGMDEDEGMATNQLVPKSSNDCSSEYCKLEPTCTENLAPTSFEVELDTSAKVWSKLDLRSTRADESLCDVSDTKLRMLSRSSEPGNKRLRHIDVRIEDQLVNLRLESDASDSSERKTYSTSRQSRRYKKGAPKSLSQDKPAKKKRGAHRRRGRRNRVPPPLPSDLHGKVKESVAVVKSSYDPYTDFRDSMVEMIVEKEIQGATDLEELLRCYLSLNSAEYHSVIVKVFADVWRELFADTN